VTDTDRGLGTGHGRRRSGDRSEHGVMTRAVFPGLRSDRGWVRAFCWVRQSPPGRTTAVTPRAASGPLSPIPIPRPPSGSEHGRRAGVGPVRVLVALRPDQCRVAVQRHRPAELVAVVSGASGRLAPWNSSAAQPDGFETTGLVDVGPDVVVDRAWSADAEAVSMRTPIPTLSPGASERTPSDPSFSPVPRVPFARGW
jgi:hypothetical protein